MDGSAKFGSDRRCQMHQEEKRVDGKAYLLHCSLHAREVPGRSRTIETATATP